MNLIIDSAISPVNLFKLYRNCMWEMSSLMRNYPSPMDFVLLDSPDLFTNNNGGR